MSAPTIALITGGNRGIGRGLVESYLKRPSYTVIATVRDPSHPSAKSLSTIPKDPSSTLIVVKLESTSETDAKTAVETLQSKYSISHLDLVIANAGTMTVNPLVIDTQAEDMMEHYKVNVVGPTLLFQATLPLLLKSSSTGRFVGISSTAGSIGDMESLPVPNGAYGPTKAALNWVIRKIHFEHFEKDGLIAFAVHPGWAKTDLGNGGALRLGIEEADTEVEVSVAGTMREIDNSTKETSGKFRSYTGEAIIW